MSKLNGYLLFLFEITNKHIFKNLICILLNILLKNFMCTLHIVRAFIFFGRCGGDRVPRVYIKKPFGNWIALKTSKIYDNFKSSTLVLEVITFNIFNLKINFYFMHYYHTN